MKMHKRLSQIIFFILLLTINPHSGLAAKAIPSTNTFPLTGQIYYANTAGGFYGIIGDDGINYQPVNLPRKFKKEGLSVKFDAQKKDSIVSAFQWGTIVQLSNVSKFTTTLTTPERQSIYVLLKRMEAFNNRDLVQLQQIDTLSKELTKEQFDSWVNKYTNYTLRYVEVFSTKSSAISGACYYTREMVNGMTLHGNTDLAMMTFTISHSTNGWQLTDMGNLRNPAVSDQTTALADLKEKALVKYNTDNLATIWQ